jgi:hypothetical protein
MLRQTGKHLVLSCFNSEHVGRWNEISKWTPYCQDGYNKSFHLILRNPDQDVCTTH